MSKKIKVAIVGVGNCAKSLVEGVLKYSQPEYEGKEIPGIMFETVGGYRVSDIEFAVAYDIDTRKYNYPLSHAIYQEPNCAIDILPGREGECSRLFSDLKEIAECPVYPAPLLDGVADHMGTNTPTTFSPHNISEYMVGNVDGFAIELQDLEVDVLLNYLPVGSEKATEFWAEVCVRSGVAMVNCIPSFIASDEQWANKFIDARIPIIGDDMRSQFGASILSAVLQDLMYSRGIDVKMHYQDNIGGNTDFLNMQDKDRLSSKKVSKENVIRAQAKVSGKEIKEHEIHAGPANYFTSLGDNKRAHILMKGEGFGGAPIELSAELSVQDSPNSAGVVIEAIRMIMSAKNKGIVGPLAGPSAWTQKTPPMDMRPGDAYSECKAFAESDEIPDGYVKINDGYYIHCSYCR
tara:strand:- start:1467 stop:2684 length:1218 start_codon:yes stop_codon:yes gene_type:complete